MAEAPTTADIRFQPDLVAQVEALLSLPGPAHLCISGPPACGQGLAAGAISAAMAGSADPVLVKALPAELSAAQPSVAIDRLRALHESASGGVLHLVELEGLLADTNAMPILAALRELLRTREDVTVVVSGDREAVDKLRALAPDLYLHFRHARVKAFTFEQMAELLAARLSEMGLELPAGFTADAIGVLRRVRIVGTLRNARVVDAMVRTAVANAAAAGRKRLLLSDLYEGTEGFVALAKETSGFVELDELIGLTDMKATVRLWMANSDLVARREQLGLHTSGMGQHMVFKGPAGTAKTTVARILGQILTETGVLASGHVIEVQRGDIISDQPEQTARRMIEIVKRALGGVLFIDEAYTLTGQKGVQDAGREAIDTLLKLMEDYREEFVVIVAGYPTHMEQFLNSNPGLRSRFVRTLNFPAYDEGELLAILDHLAAKRGFNVEPGVHDQLRSRLRLASQYPGFGNGRHIRNLLEAAIVRQGTRLTSAATDDELRTLTAEDFVDPAAPTE